MSNVFASIAPEPKPAPHRRDAQENSYWRACREVADEMTASGHPLDAGQVAWIESRVRQVAMRRAGGRAVVSGRIR